MKKLKNKLTWCNVLILFTIVFILWIFMKYPLIFYVDSTEYFRYIEILFRELPFIHWSPLRGPTFAALIFISMILFGKGKVSLLICSCMCFAFMIFLIIFIMKKFIRNKYSYFLSYIICFAAILLNPILFGYFHSYLTEFAVFPFLLLSTYIVYNWQKKEQSTKSFIFNYIIFSAIGIFLWFLKQQYLAIMLFPLLLSIVLSIIKLEKLKNISLKILMTLLFMLSVICADKLWTKILVYKGIDYYSSNRTTSSFVPKGIIFGLTNFQLNYDEKYYDLEFLKENKMINNKELKTIEKHKENLNEFVHFILVNVYNEDNKLIDIMVLEYSDGKLLLNNSLEFYKEAITKYPKLTIKSYYNNYLSIINYYAIKTTPFGTFLPEKSYKFMGYENSGIGLAPFRLKTNFNIAKDYSSENIKRFYSKNYKSDIINKFVNKSQQTYINLYVILGIIAPIMCLLSVILLKLTKNKAYEFLFISFGFSFAYVLFLAMFGLVIDRYGFIIYPLLMLSTVIFIYLFIEIVYKYIKNKRNRDQILISVIVPVYNTEKYLDKCLKSIISAKVKNMEIIIINDGSRDNSAKIIKKYKKKYKFIKYINKSNEGLSSVKNLGIIEAKGKYISFIDSDDYINKNFYRSALKYMKNDVDLIIYDFNNVDEDKSFETLAKCDIYKNYNENEALLYTSIMPSSCNKIIKTSIFKENNIYFPERILYEDFATTPLIFIKSKNIQYINKAYYNYRIDNNSIMRNDNYIRKYNNMLESTRILVERIKKEKEFDRKRFLIHNCLWRIEDFILDNLYCINRVTRFYLTLKLKQKLSKFIKELYSFDEVKTAFNEIKNIELRQYYLERNQYLCKNQYLKLYLFMLKHRLYENRPNFCYEFNKSIIKKGN